MPNYKRLYLPGHYVFLTLNTFRRNSILIENIALLRESFLAARRKHAFGLFAAVVLPDHLHLLIRPEHQDVYPEIVREIKRHFSVHCDPNAYAQFLHGDSPVRPSKSEKPVWRHRYFEHTIRDETSLRRHADYIHHNPVRHGHADKPAEWPHSTFARFVSHGWYASDWSGVAAEDMDLE